MKELPEKLQPIAERFFRDLENSRREGRSGPENPVTATKICAGYKKLNIEIDNRDVRKMVEYARSKRIPIGSVNDGYFWCIFPSDWDAVIIYLKGEARKLENLVRECEKMKSEMVFDEAGQGDLMKTMVEKFELQKVA